MGLLAVHEVKEKKRGGRKGHACGGGDGSVGILSCNFFFFFFVLFWIFWWVGILSLFFCLAEDKIWLRIVGKN